MGHTKATTDQRRCVSDLLSIELGRLTARRLLDHPEVVLAQARENLATMRAAHVDGSVDRWLDEWERLLKGPVNRVVEVLTADDESARQLRQNTPFAGVVPARERHELIARLRRQRDRDCGENTSST